MLKKFIKFMTVSSFVAASPMALAAVMADQVGGVTIAPAQTQVPKQYQKAPTRHETMTTHEQNAPQYQVKPKTIHNTASRHAALTTHAPVTSAPVASAATAPTGKAAKGSLPKPGFDRVVPHTQPITLAESEHAGMGYYFTSEDYHPYVGAEVSYEYFQLPDFGMGSASSTGIQSKARFKNTPSRFIAIPKIYTGYHFENHFIPMLFGEHANLELSFSWFNSGDSDHNGNTRTGATWVINPGSPAPKPNALNLRDYRHGLSMRYRNVALYFRGDHTTSNPHLVMSPFMGAVYTYFDQQNHASIQYQGSDVGPWYTNRIDKEDVATNYFGLTFGNNLKYLFSTHFSTNLNLEVQLLRATSSLSALQHPNLPFDNTAISVKDSNNKWTYRAMAAFGLNYAFTASPASPTVYFNLGVDRWGYVAEIKNPRGTAETKKARIIDDAEYNPFVTLGVRLPLTM